LHPLFTIPFENNRLPVGGDHAKEMARLVGNK
jgi:hypothetical protein